MIFGLFAPTTTAHRAGRWLRAAALASMLLAVSVSFAAPAGPDLESKPLPAPTSKAQSRPDDAVPLRSGAAESHMGGSVFQTVAALGAVVSVILVVGLVVKKAARRGGGLLGALGPGGRAPSGLLEVLGRYPVGRGSTLVLLKLDRRVLLLCQNGSGKLGGGSGMSTLAEINDPEEVASILLKTRDEEGDTLAKKFQSLLRGEEKAAADVLEQPLSTRATSVTGPDSFELSQARARTKPSSAIRTRLDSLRTSGRPAAGVKAR